MGRLPALRLLDRVLDAMGHRSSTPEPLDSATTRRLGFDYEGVDRR
jgi:hypothetical protein